MLLVHMICYSIQLLWFRPHYIKENILHLRIKLTALTEILCRDLLVLSLDITKESEEIQARLIISKGC